MIIKIDELLGAYDTSREKLIEKNPEYEKDFQKIELYYKKYQENPSPVVEEKLNQTILGYVEKLKKENPEIFEKQEEPEVETEQEGTYKQMLKDFYSLVELGEVSDLNDFLSKAGDENIKKLFEAQNYKALYSAAVSRNTFMVGYLMEQGERLEILTDMVLARNGVILSNLIAMLDVSIVKQAIEAMKKDPESATAVLKKSLALEQAEETGDEDIADMFEQLYDEFGIPKKKAKVKEAIKEEKSIKSVIESIRSGEVTLDTVLVAGMEKRMAIGIITTPEQIVAGDTYQYVAPTQYAKIFNDKVVGQDSDYTRFEAKSTDFEKRFGAAVYEFGFAWFNMLNLPSVNDFIALMYIANIGSEVMVERKDQTLRDEFRSNLSALISFPQNSKIGDKMFQVTQSNVENLQRAGFLDADFCPTKMMYCAVVLHSFSFPAGTHPFELVQIPMDELFEFNILKGTYYNQVFFTDGDILYHNVATSINAANSMIMVDIARTMTLNLTSTGRADIERSKAEIERFYPIFYSVPKSQVSIPTFSIAMLEVQNRNINWGVYEVKGENGKATFINSYALSNFMNLNKGQKMELETYKGSLSSQIFASPAEGIICTQGKKVAAIRGLNKVSFLSENFGQNYKKYYEAMFAKNFLQTQVLDQLEPEFSTAMKATPQMRVTTIHPYLTYTAPKKQVATPYVATQTVKAAPAKDDRIYLTKKDSRDLIDQKYWPVFDVVMNIKGEQRDEAILDQMTFLNLDTIRPKQLLFLGFDLERWKVSGTTLKFKTKYRLRIPNLGYTYYLEKI